VKEIDIGYVCNTSLDRNVLLTRHTGPCIGRLAPPPASDERPPGRSAPAPWDYVDGNTAPIWTGASMLAAVAPTIAAASLSFPPLGIAAGKPAFAMPGLSPLLPAPHPFCSPPLGVAPPSFWVLEACRKLPVASTCFRISAGARGRKGGAPVSALEKGEEGENEIPP